MYTVRYARQQLLRQLQLLGQPLFDEKRFHHQRVDIDGSLVELLSIKLDPFLSLSSLFENWTSRIGLIGLSFPFSTYAESHQSVS